MKPRASLLWQSGRFPARTNPKAVRCVRRAKLRHDGQWRRTGRPLGCVTCTNTRVPGDCLNDKVAKVVRFLKKKTHSGNTNYALYRETSHSSRCNFTRRVIRANMTKILSAYRVVKSLRQGCAHASAWPRLQGSKHFSVKVSEQCVREGGRSTKRL